MKIMKSAIIIKSSKSRMTSSQTGANVRERDRRRREK